MKILVTGANGFVGRALVTQLLSRQHQVRALVLPHEIIPEDWDKKVEVVRGDIAEEKSVRAVAQNQEAIIHLAAHVALWDKAQSYERVTIGGTRNVLESASENNAHVTLLSSITVYGDALANQNCDEEQAVGIAQGRYGASKQAQEKLVREFENQRGLRATIVRAGPVYGPYCLPWVLAFVRLLQRGWPCYIGDGRQNSNLCYVDNLAELLARLPSTPQAVGRTYNAHDGDLSWHQYVCDLARISNSKTPVAMTERVAGNAAHIGEMLCRVIPAYKKIAFTREACNLMNARGSVPIARLENEIGFKSPVLYDVAMEKIGRSLK